MFVTSDIFDLPEIARFRKQSWRENLLCGVAVHGAEWPGYQAAASFLFEAAKERSLLEELKWASYSRPEDKRFNEIKPSSFARLLAGKLKGAGGASNVILRGEGSTAGSAS